MVKIEEEKEEKIENEMKKEVIIKWKGIFENKENFKIK